MGGFRSRLRRWHVWLGWLVGLPFLFWTVSGLVMVAKPIEEVRGEHLIRDLGSIAGPVGVRLPELEGWEFKSLTLVPRAGGARWVMVLADGQAVMFDPRTGRPIPRLSAPDAAREVSGRYLGKAGIVSTRLIGPGEAPIEFRRDTSAWQVRMSDGTHFYVDSGTGEVVAKRTRWWRFYDFMWGLHIMDLQGREDTHNPWVVSFGILSLGMVLLAMLLLPLTIRRRNGKNGNGKGVSSS